LWCSRGGTNFRIKGEKKNAVREPPAGSLVTFKGEGGGKTQPNRYRKKGRAERGIKRGIRRTGSYAGETFTNKKRMREISLKWS